MVLAEHFEEELVVGIFDRGMLAFPDGGILLKSGRVSPFYYNSRGVLSLSKSLDKSGVMPIDRQKQFRRTLVLGYSALLQEIEIKQPFDHVFGKSQATTAFAAVAAFEANLSYLWERVNEPNKTYGDHQIIEGDYESGDRVVLADDTVTDGESKILGMAVLRAAKLNPVAVALNFDREEGGVQTLEQEKDHKLAVFSLVTISRAVPILVANKRINGKMIYDLHAYYESLKAEGIPTTYKIVP